MDRYILKPKEEFPHQIKTEIKTEIVTETDDTPQDYQQCIIKEELMLSSSDLEYSADEFESESNDQEKRNVDDLTNESPRKKQETPRSSSSSIEFRSSKKVDHNFALVISKLGKANCNKCQKQFKAVARQARCKLCSKAYIYSCKICLDSSYKTFTDLCRHLKLKHTSLHELYNCSICHKSYKLPKQLNYHLKFKHTPLSELYTCSDCNKCFVEKRRLKEHVKVCGLDPKFKCDLCPYIAKYKCNLANHVKNKHSMMILICNRCGKKYTHQRSFRRHINVYCGKKRSAECEHCDYGAYRKDQLVKHLKDKHSEVFRKYI